MGRFQRTVTLLYLTLIIQNMTNSRLYIITNTCY